MTDGGREESGPEGAAGNLRVSRPQAVRVAGGPGGLYRHWPGGV
jgi:hypothetical protein